MSDKSNSKSATSVKNGGDKSKKPLPTKAIGFRPSSSITSFPVGPSPATSQSKNPVGLSRLVTQAYGKHPETNASPDPNHGDFVRSIIDTMAQHEGNADTDDEILLTNPHSIGPMRVSSPSRLQDILPPLPPLPSSSSSSGSSSSSSSSYDSGTNETIAAGTVAPVQQTLPAIPWKSNTRTTAFEALKPQVQHNLQVYQQQLGEVEPMQPYCDALNETLKQINTQNVKTAEGLAIGNVFDLTEKIDILKNEFAATLSRQPTATWQASDTFITATRKLCAEARAVHQQAARTRKDAAAMHPRVLLQKLMDYVSGGAEESKEKGSRKRKRVAFSKAPPAVINTDRNKRPRVSTSKEATDDHDYDPDVINSSDLDSDDEESVTKTSGSVALLDAGSGSGSSSGSDSDRPLKKRAISGKDVQKQRELAPLEQKRLLEQDPTRFIRARKFEIVKEDGQTSRDRKLFKKLVDRYAKKSDSVWKHKRWSHRELKCLTLFCKLFPDTPRHHKLWDSFMPQRTSDAKYWKAARWVCRPKK